MIKNKKILVVGAGGFIGGYITKKLLDEGVLDKVKTFEELPIVHTGCDTYASIYPEFKKYMKDHTIDEVVDYVLGLTPQGKWTMDNGQDIHFILTGGEPLLGWQRFYVELFEHPRMQDLKNVTFETNTTQPLHKDFEEYLRKQTRFKVTWSCSPKLSVSGEPWETAIKPDIARSYLNLLLLIQLTLMKWVRQLKNILRLESMFRYIVCH